MASAAGEYRYAHREFSTNGNLARDLDWAVRERELEHAGRAPLHEEQPSPAVRRREQSLVREQVLVRERQKVPVLTVMGMAAVIGMAVMLLLSYVQLTTLAADTVTLRAELAALETENVTLTAQHEQMFDMATVKEVAAAAGMGKPAASQITYLDIAGEDSATVYQTDSGGVSVLSRLLSSLHHGVYAVVEYFD